MVLPPLHQARPAQRGGARRHQAQGGGGRGGDDDDDDSYDDDNDDDIDDQVKQEAKDPLVVTGTSDQSKLELRTQVSCDWSVVNTDF